MKKLGELKGKYLEYLLSDQNIYLAIYSLQSYIFEYGLLTDEDKEIYHRLQDKFDEEYIGETIKKVKKKIEKLLEDDSEFIKAKVYFRPKKLDSEKLEDKKVIYRPMHTADIISQIAIVAMLHLFIYDIPEDNSDTPKDEKGKLYLSNLSRLIPGNFYGNRVSLKPEVLFKPWKKQYQEYTQKANEALKKYHTSLEYKYEVVLDLENFFPSIDPMLIYHFILHHLPVNLKTNDRELMKILLTKLLFCKIEKTEVAKKLWNEYYKKTKKENSELNTEELTMTSLKGFVRGIPQGLPQSYFLGNICMIPISGIFSKVFKGLSYYYVDDSIIFTNYVEEEAFEQQLKRINKEIENLEKNLLADWPDIRPEGAVSLKKEGYYGIKVHESIKSSFTRMDSIDSSEVYLKCVSREASQIGNEIFRMFSDEEDVILEKRMKVLSAEVQKKIDELDQKIDEWNQKIDDQEKQINLLDESELVYSKRKLQDLKKFRDRWIRYYKFFEYRSIKMGLRSQQNKDTLKDIIFVDQNGKPDIIKFMEHYRENIWDAAIAIYSNSLNEHKGKKELGEYINEINTACFGYENQTSSYLYKVYDELISQEVSAKMSKEMLRRMEYGDPYRSLKKYAVWKLKDYANKHYKVAETVTEKLAELSESEMLGQILSEKMVEIMQVVCANTEQVLRMVSNTVYSYLFNVEIEDSFVVTKSSRKPLSCGEMRILLFLRNRMFSEKEFKERKILLSDSGNKSVIDYSIMEVVDIFRSFVGDPVRIDKLILTHQYTCEIWKNGSKHLYFYTLHNQEHAIVLIRNIVKLVHAIGFLQVSSLDFYILFLACYLHDISMVKIPSLDSFLTDTEEADRLALEFILEMFPDDIAHVKRRMVEVYQKVDGFFEKKIRSNHAADSAYEIREQNDFEYLEDTLREFVAEVSEAHNSDVGEIYYTKSTARSKKISMKFDKMLLRLADVLDMSNYRISRPILHHNLDQMSNESAFHWISHLLTQGYEIETEYQSIFDEKEANQDKDVRHDCSMIQRLAPKSITEKVVLTIYVDMSQMSQLDIQEKCSFAKINREDIGDEGFELTCGTPCGAEGEEGKRCNFLCRWFTVKNKYLLEELAALQEYLNRTPDNYFLSVISVRIKVAKKTSLDARQFEVLKEYLQDK